MTSNQIYKALWDSVGDSVGASVRTKLQTYDFSPLQIDGTSV